MIFLKSAEAKLLLTGNWVDWEDVSTGRYDGDGFEHPNHDEDGEW